MGNLQQKCETCCNVSGETELPKEQKEPELFVIDDGSRAGRRLLIDTAGAAYQEREYPVGTYKGQMKDGMRVGFGECRYRMGPRYEGQWWMDRYHGEGVFTDDESKYTGQWRNGRKNGAGEERWEDDGTRYIGNFLDGNKHGHGRYIWQNGNVYVGDFRQDAVEGVGTLHWPDGRKYTGQWYAGTQHGRGKYTNEYGAVSEVFFWKGHKTTQEEFEKKFQESEYSAMVQNKGQNVHQPSPGPMESSSGEKEEAKLAV